MSVLTLVRHAQASFLAENYDELSARGRKQARLLGEFWVSRKIDFDEVYCGPRVRHRDTAAIVGSAFTGAGRRWPDPVVLEELDEYDLGNLLQHLAPDLSRREIAFAELVERYLQNRDGPERGRSFQRMFEALTLHWAMTPCTIDGVEGFAGFRSRVERGLNLVMEKPGSGRRVVLFTSSGFIGTSISQTLDASNRMALELSWRLRNSSPTHAR
jgi:broad specificity phosphatase PhoE